MSCADRILGALMRRVELILVSIAVVGGYSMAAGAAENSPAKWTAPRTPHGHPDLQGVWTNATITPLERPAELGERRSLSEAEARTMETRAARNVERGAAPSDLSRELPPAGDGVGG